MAQYRSGEDAQVGDVVRCAIPNCPWCDQKAEFTVVEVHKAAVLLRNERNVIPAQHLALVRREQPKEQPMQENPLVVWPEEQKQLTWLELEVGETFIFDIEPRQSQLICVRVHAGWRPWMYQNGKAYISPNSLVSQEQNPVRRLKLTTPPQFTVI